MKINYIIIILFVIVNLFCQDLNQLSISGKAQREAGEIVPGDVLDKNKEQAALVVFITDLEVEMDFRPWNGAVKISNPGIGRWNVYVSPGERAIDVHATGYKMLEVVLSTYGIQNIKSGEVYHLEITGEQKIENLPVMIITDPSNVKVIIDEKLVGRTEEGRLVDLMLGVGEHEIKLEADGFESKVERILVDNENQVFNYKLDEEMLAVVNLDTEPEGAEIYIDDKFFGKTPLHDFYPAGNYTIKIEKENYDTIIEPITITDNTDKTFYLEDIRATLTIKTHPNATVYINEDKGHKGGVENLRLKPQVAKIKILMPKAETIEKMVELGKREKVTKEYYPEVATGIVMINVIPTDAEIQLAGDGEEYYTAKGKKTFREVPVGEYKVLAMKEGYLSELEGFTLEEDETEQIQMQLYKGRDDDSINQLFWGGKFRMVPLEIMTNQSGAKVYVDGELKGMTENKMIKLKVLQGEKIIKLEKKGFETQTSKILLTPENSVYNIELKPAMPAVVKITSLPSGALITMDDTVEIGRTPYEDFYDTGLHRIRLEMEGYVTIEGEITIKEPETKRFYRLYNDDVILTINTYPNAIVKFNDQEFKGGVKDYKIKPQELEITVEVTKGDTLKHVANLKPSAVETLELYPVIKSGVVQVMVIPLTATIELFGDSGEYFKGSGRECFEDVPIGDYELVISAEGYKTQHESFNLILNETEQLQAHLEEGEDFIEYETNSGITMLSVEGGSFEMGSNRGLDEKPVHEVSLDNFYLSKYEITQEQYEKIMKQNPASMTSAGSEAPVENVSWYDAVTFCNVLSKKEGLQKCYSGEGKNITCDFSADGYRLPTEAEWEYAARGGVKMGEFKYSGSDDIDEVAIYKKNCGRSTVPVGSKASNELGFCDMCGNVWEWCWDRYGKFSKEKQDNPLGADSGRRRVQRGGSWVSDSSHCRVTIRYPYFPQKSNYNIGFRIARTPK